MGDGADRSTTHDVATVRRARDVVQEQIWCVLAERAPNSEEALLHKMCADFGLPTISVLCHLLLCRQRRLERLGALHKAMWWWCALSLLQ